MLYGLPNAFCVVPCARFLVLLAAVPGVVFCRSALTHQQRSSEPLDVEGMRAC